ncbi:hypothetical protein [Kutzneria buriramensis]|uniref:Uncharacterized protein n=1 Tax=Kutzneria buriramensis TaxID=1045776 RepID=A0A3E0G8L4_9PSEU|nr:hypothetical protein [Kutzneria buriramensis]REH18312.1 hypothetical protein BCF44_13667 [Kutzneria buriramensis]
MRVGQTDEIRARAAAAKAAITALADAVAAAELAAAPPPEQGTGGGAELAAALARVRAAGRARVTVRELVAELVTEAAETVLDGELLAARRVQPRGASWRELAEVLEVSHQALSKRARRRGLDPGRTTLDGRPGTSLRAVSQPSTETLRWRSAAAEHRQRLAADAAARKTTTSTPVPAAGTGAAFWRAQRQR